MEHETLVPIQKKEQTQSAEDYIKLLKRLFEKLGQVEDKMVEIRGINDTFFDYLDSYNMQQKRGKFYSDSEVGY